MKKQKSLSKLKSEAWKLFSYLIKLRYSENGTDTKCFTCDSFLVIGTSNCQAGHCFPKSAYPGLYFDFDNVRPQCYHCNINLSGNTHVFIEKLKEEIGEEKYNELNARRHNSIKLTKSDYKDKMR
jgi:hypothetical protein